jgi:regulator of cell morphogenesis and NO signaling
MELLVARSFIVTILPKLTRQRLWRGVCFLHGNEGVDPMIDLNTMTVRDIALAAPATTRVFEEYKIDFCCGGRKSLNEACSNAGVEFGEVARKLESILDEPAAAQDPEKMSISDLVNYIIDKHHEFTRSEMLRLGGLMEKVAFKHGESHPELSELKENFQLLINDLLTHMRKEEMVLFPYMQDLARAKQNNTTPLLPPFGTVSHPVRMMEFEHEEAGNILRKMREVTKDYSLPEGACPSYTALYFGLDALEKDLHQHIHLENNVLFPEAQAVEKTVFSLN